MAIQRNQGDDPEPLEDIRTDDNMPDAEDDDRVDMKCYGTIEGPFTSGHPAISSVIWKIPDFLSRPVIKVNSPKFTIGNITWNVLLQIEERSGGMGAFLDSSPMEEHDPDFSVNAVFELSAENKNPLLTEPRLLYHIFNRESSDWGFRELVKKEHLEDADAGFLINDVLSIKITVRVLSASENREYLSRKQPDIWLHDPKTETGYVGLKNQGATCYMNSLLQSLYHVPALQRAVYKMPTEQEAQVKRQRTATQHPAVITRQENNNVQESVALALQRVFYHLQHSNKSVGTKQLTKSFGWDAIDAFTQHDVQELDRVLCDNLEEKMKGTPVEKEVPRLFRGQLKNYVKCLNVDFQSERVEDFYDLSLNVRGCKDLKESLEKYIEPERLDGDNKYMAEGHGLQDAEKGCTFSSFPPVLHLHLKRFEYDPVRDANVKINDRFEFDEEIDLAPYMEKNPGHPEHYQLHSVLVHSGDVHGGHYYAYIRPDTREDKWYKFNDERVTIVSKEEAIESNFGFEEENDRLPQGQGLMVRNRLAPRRYSNAYMIVYVKKNAVDDVLKPLAEQEIPSHLRQRFKVEEEEEELRRKEKSEQHLKVTLKVATWKHLLQHREADLHSWQDVLMLQVNKTMTVDELKNTIRETADVQAPDLRIWPCCKRKNETVRTQSPTRAPGDTPLQELRSFNNALQDYVMLFVEELHARSRPTEKIEEKDALIFFKRWDPHEHKLSYLGHMIFKPTTKVTQMVEAARAEFMPRWEMRDLEALEELKPDKIENLTYSVFDDNRQAYRDAILQDRQVELQSGDIIVFQPKDVAGTRECVKDHYDYLYHKVLVSFRSKAAPDKEAFELWLNSQSQYEHVCEKVAHEVNELKLAATPPADGDKLQLWRHSHKDGGPDRSPAERKPDWQLQDILINNHHGQDKNIVYYEELWYSVDDLKTKMLLRYKMGFGGRGGTNEVLVSRSPPEAVADALSDAARLLGDECPAELFLCRVRQGRIDSYFPNEEEEESRSELSKALESHQLQVVGIGARAGGVADGYRGGYDANNERSAEGWLLKVSHFEWDAKSMRERNNAQPGAVPSDRSARHYGDPLLVRVTAQETVGQLKRKVRAAVEEQYKKPKDAETKGKEPTMQSISEWPLYLFTNSPPEELADDDLSLEEAKCTDISCCVGVEHPDKHRYSNSLRTVEKAIKISR